MVHDPRLGDFRNFLFLSWKHLNLPDPTAIQYDIAEYLQNGPKRCCIEAFRGVGKSWITSAFVCWYLLMDPTRNILVVSGSKSRSDDFSTFTLRLINEMECLKHLRPGEHQRNSKIAFDVGPAPASHAPSVKSVGITGQITGSRADLIVADDVESQNNSMTQGMRDRLSESIKEFDAVLKPSGRVVYLGTPQTEQSIYNELPSRGYEVRIWPARYPTSKQVESLGKKLAPKILDELAHNPDCEGKPTDPARFTDEDLIEREASYGRSGFNLQFMLDTTLSDQDRYPLKLSDLTVMDLDPDVGPEKVVWSSDRDLAIEDIPNVGFNGDRFYKPYKVQGNMIPYKGAVMAIDPSGRGRDETAYAVVKSLNSQLFLTAAGGLRGGYSPETLERLAMLARDQKVKHVIVESNFGDGMFTSLLNPYLSRIYPVTVEEVRHSIQKEKRIIDTLEPVVNQHRLIVDRRVVQKDYDSTRDLPTELALKYQLFYQFSRITRDRGALAQDDRLDALCMAVGYWVTAMGQDIESQIRYARDEALKRELNRFMDAVNNVKRGPQPLTWM